MGMGGGSRGGIFLCCGWLLSGFANVAPDTASHDICTDVSAKLAGPQLTELPKK